jgi:glycosyltransferase involved in cell wall biosynthesis
MKLSLFTPTHKSTYLVEAYASLKAQTLTDWEWVILPNGNDVKIPEIIRKDPRVRLVEVKTNSTNIGALKREACDAASGDAFIEFDHDDLLVPGDSLQKIHDKFKNGADFVYSDTAVFKCKENGANNIGFSPFTYSLQHGWQDYDIKVYGHKLKATRCFPVSPRSLSEIYYAPDHVRSWSRKAYYKAGGHNPELSVCDDHELMIKTYITGAQFEHTGGCHYLYRMFAHNTVWARNQLIQDTTLSLRQKYVQQLIESWVKRNSLPTLNITKLKATGWNADRQLLQGFGTDNYGHIFADTELQWWTGRQVREFMDAAYTALVPGGYLTIIVPEVHSGMGYGDVEWQSHFSAVSMSPYTRQNVAKVNGKINCRFQQINCLEIFPSDWHKDNNFKFLKFELVALKGQRHPGLQHI